MWGDVWGDVAGLYSDWIIEPGKQPLFLVFVSFIVGFLGIRTSTRMIRAQVRWWFGNVTPGGVHVHHMVFGIVLMLGCGVGAFSRIGGIAPWAELFAVGFGIGAALVLDEFALILHLQDVYWAEQGRQSVDAVILGAAIAGLLVLGASPFGVAEEPNVEQTGWGVVTLVAQNMLFVVIAFLRGKVWTGALGIFVPFVAFVGALRLARPRSPWARWRYKPGSKKLARAEAREEKIDRRWRRARRSMGDFVAGRPDT